MLFRSIALAGSLLFPTQTDATQLSQSEPMPELQELRAYDSCYSALRTVRVIPFVGYYRLRFPDSGFERICGVSESVFDTLATTGFAKAEARGVTDDGAQELAMARYVDEHTGGAVCQYYRDLQRELDHRNLRSFYVEHRAVFFGCVDGEPLSMAEYEQRVYVEMGKAIREYVFSTESGAPPKMKLLMRSSSCPPILETLDALATAWSDVCDVYIYDSELTTEEKFEEVMAKFPANTIEALADSRVIVYIPEEIDGKVKYEVDRVLQLDEAAWPTLEQLLLEHFERMRKENGETPQTHPSVMQTSPAIHQTLPAQTQPTSPSAPAPRP